MSVSAFLLLSHPLFICASSASRAYPGADAPYRYKGAAATSPNACARPRNVSPIRAVQIHADRERDPIERERPDRYLREREKERERSAAPAPKKGTGDEVRCSVPLPAVTSTSTLSMPVSSVRLAPSSSNGLKLTSSPDDLRSSQAPHYKRGNAIGVPPGCRLIFRPQTILIRRRCISTTRQALSS
ncbi:hypothetical protein C8J57DRAFT_1733628 [Mycena rebaudengoi]|nr:hypothetical protein C8J57DRAFT_1733628 [Mycena rebaudengoi]